MNIDICNTKKFIPAFGETKVSDIYTNKKNRVLNISDASLKRFEDYCDLIEENGFVKREYRQHGNFYYASFEKNSIGIFIIYYENLREINITIENECKYFSYKDEIQPQNVSAQITQIELADYGMSYVIRLSDGRFIVFDGGRNFEPHIENLYKCLKNSSPDLKPVIASWIITHPDSDHYHCFIAFCEKYGKDVVLQKIMFNFPEHNDFKLYHDLEKSGYWGPDCERLLDMYKQIEAIGAEVYTPHTGQIYEIGEATCEILSCIGDVVHNSYWRNKNEPCLVIKMELLGQILLWMGDASCKYSRLYEKYGTYLKSDILQVPHHGFGSLGDDEEIACYNEIKPSVCFIPVADYKCYQNMSAYRKSTNYLITKMNVDEIITGDNPQTRLLPYTPPHTAKKEYQEKYAQGYLNNGANAWFFTGLNSDNKEDFTFTFVNPINQKANVEINIYFNGKQDILRIKAQVPPSLSDICIIDQEVVDADWLFYNPNSLSKVPIPENTSFAVRFISDLPIVISHKNHSAAYHSHYIR